MSEDPNTVVIETDLDARPEKVWRAISEPALRDAWLSPETAGVDCEVLQADPARGLRLGWRETAGGAPSEVDFTLTPTPGGGTRLRVVHRRLAQRPAARRGVQLRMAA